MTKPDMLKAALAYAEKGLSVIPCHHILGDGSCSCGNKDCSSKGKHPRSTWKGKQKERLTEAGLRSRWKEHPDSNIGIVTGEISQVIVIDIDGKKGLESLEAIGLTLETMPMTPTAHTGGGGYHLYYRYSEGAARTKVGVLDKVDIRADGGIVIAPPSLHQSGKRYAWLEDRNLDDVPIADFDFSSLVKPASEPAKEAEPVALVPEGKRNDWVFRRMCGYRNKGDSEETIYKKGKIDYEQRCVHDPPMTDKELRDMAHSAFTRYEPAVEVHRSDTGNASMMVSIYGDTLRYDHKRKRWLRWGKHRWETNYDGHISRLAQEIARERQRRALAIKDLEGRKKEFSWGISSESRGKVEACVALAKIMEPIADDGTNWDRDIMLLGTPNGVVDLRMGELREGKAEDRITMSTGVDFNPDAKCPRWEQFLIEIFEDAELIDWLWRVLGYSVMGETTEQIFMVGHGEGSNGKSKFFEAVCNALGDYAYYTPFATFGLPAPSSTNDLAALEHRRFVTSSETNIGTRLNIERIKAVSGGDKMTARFLYQEFETYQPHLKLWLFVNHLPDINDDTIATWRRVRLIPFTKTFIREAEDKRLGDKLKAEAQGILTWLVRGCLEWQKRGLTPVPQCVRAATGEYRMETDTIMSFINDRCVKGEGEEVRARQLYLTYKTWAEGAVGRNKVLTETAFGRQMGKKYEKKEKAKGIYYLGIDLADKGRYINMTADEESE